MIKGKKILISLGGTYEPIDSVRGITNKSSGKMGLELAKEAYIRGADLTLVVANVSVEIPNVFDVIHVETSGEMNDVILDLISDFDIFISTAAVSDFEFKQIDDKKIDSNSSLFLNLKPTTKIIRQVKRLIQIYSWLVLKLNLIFQKMILFHVQENRLRLRELIWS